MNNLTSTPASGLSAAPGKPAVTKLSQRAILGYSIGDLGINLNFQMIGFYLAYFYTDVFGISPGHVAGLFLVARIWDAINDPIMGYIADHTRSRWGKFRPYLLYAAIPLNLVLVACFLTPDLSPGWKVAYAYITYTLHGMVFTAIALPYSSISAVMTQDQQERAVISTYRMFFAVVVALSVIAVGVRPFVALFETEQQGFLAAAVVLSIFSTLLLWASFLFSRERVQAPQERYRLRDIIPILLRNRELLILAAAMLLNTSVWVIGNAVALYYFKYILNDASLQSMFFLIMIPCNIVGVAITPWITRRIGKHKTFMIGSLIVAVFSILRHFAPDSILTMIFGLSMVATIGQMMCSITQWGMLPDCVEYGHYKTGFRSEGIPFAFFSFMQKTGMALAGSFAALVMSLTGFVANTDLLPGAEQGIRLLFNIAPGVCSALCLVVLFFYRLDGSYYNRIIGHLEKGETEADLRQR
ncbi:MAG: putative symporter YjmB [Verrucomicrobiota bacterium]